MARPRLRRASQLDARARARNESVPPLYGRRGVSAVEGRLASIQEALGTAVRRDGKGGREGRGGGEGGTAPSPPSCPSRPSRLSIAGRTSAASVPRPPGCEWPSR